MDYRNPDHLAELCDPLRGEAIGWTDYMAPSDVALTNWGTGGWNNDRTFVMIYNIKKHSIRTFDAELWVERAVAEQFWHKEMNDWWFEDNGEFVWDRSDGAPHILRAIANNYRHLTWTPWTTSNRENGFGAAHEVIKTLLHQNGWPNTFDTDQFNADFIRAQHKPSGKGYAEQSLKRIDQLAGYNHTVIEDDLTWYDTDEGQIRGWEKRLLRDRSQYESESNAEERELKRYYYQRTIWVLEDAKEELKAAQADVERLCPDGVCTKEEDMVLWEYLALQRTHEEERYSNYSEHCRHLLDVTPSYYPDLSDKCIANKLTRRKWLDLALEQSRTEAVAHCEHSSCELLPFKDVYDRARDLIVKLQQQTASDVADLKRLDAEYKSKMSALGVKARSQIESDMAERENFKSWRETQIERIREEMARLKKGETADRGRKGLFDILRKEEED